MSDIGLILALSLLIGVASQLFARILQVPGIVVLLVFGVLLGPDGLGVIKTGAMGAILPEIVGTAVAVILFEGGLGVRITQIRRESKTIIRLITSGALITAIGSAVTARLVLGWSWVLSWLFGSLVIVTGPTVIGPLLRRINVKRNVSAILNAEAVLIDPIGAILALVVLDVATSSADLSVGEGIIEFVYRFAVGILIGVVSGIAIARAVKLEKLVPAEYSNIFVLASVLCLFHASNEVVPESGIMAVTVAGVVVGNLKVPIHKELSEFKEQLTMMLIGMLFILLAADTRIHTIIELGGKGLLLIAILTLVLRPLEVLWCARGSGLTWREKAFLAWMSPRGIVAAAVASLFASTLETNHLGGGQELRAAVFFVIAATVIVQGVFAAPLATLLKIRVIQSGFVLFGAHALNRLLARVVLHYEDDVVLVDRDADSCQTAERQALSIVMGDALYANVLRRARVESKMYLVASTENDNLNYMILRRCREIAKKGSAYLVTRSQNFDAGALRSIQAGVWPGGVFDVGYWCQRIEAGEVGVFEGEVTASTAVESAKLTGVFSPRLSQALPWIVVRQGRVQIYDAGADIGPKQKLIFLAHLPLLDELLAELKPLFGGIRKLDLV